MPKMIPMPPPGLTPPALSKECMLLNDTLQITFNHNGIFASLSQGFFNLPDLPAFPGEFYPKGNLTTGKSKKPGDIALTFFDLDTGKPYVCILTIAPVCP